MTTKESSAVIQDIRALLGSGSAGSASDAQLLERFHVHYGEPEAELAFAVLVARHGPMVLGVCRRTLADPNDAADAFQATFLVLVRKARSVRVDDSLGRWLYGVSRRVAAKSKAAKAQRAAREESGSGAEPADKDRRPDAGHRELLEAIDEEVEKLPGPYRAAVVLCDLGGLAHATAARQLGCAVGTIESRLSRGRRLLRERLSRRGLAPMTGGFEGLCLRGVPDSLARSTVEVAQRSATASTAISTLFDATMKELAMRKALTTVFGLGAFTVACGLGIAVAPPVKADHDAAKPRERPGATLERPKLEPEWQLAPPARIKPGDTLVIEVLEALPGRPISGERLVRPDGTISLGFYGDLMVAGLNRMEIKSRLVEHLRQFISDDYLGLSRTDPGDLDDPNDDRQVPVDPKDSDRLFVDDTLNYAPRRTATPRTSNDEATRIQPGDQVMIEVLKPLPGRPISGIHSVRPDGTISLGFYGDLKVAGLNHQTIKQRLIAHLGRFLSKEHLGLTRKEAKSGKTIEVEPTESDQIFVTASPNPGNEPHRLTSERTGEKLDRILQSLGELNRPTPPRGRPEPAMANRLEEHDRRLGAIETKLDRLIQAIEGLK